jgi:hypothetical protein
MTTAALSDTFHKKWEIHSPMILAAAFFGLAMWKGAAIYEYADKSRWHIDQLYTCIFTFSTVITAFLFTFYTFIITGERGFLSASRNTIYFKQTISYTFKAIVVGTILAFATIPMLVVQPVPKAGEFWMLATSAWGALAVWASTSFVRAAWLFAIFAGK